MNLKKLFCLCTALLLVVSMAACGAPDTGSSAAAPAASEGGEESAPAPAEGGEGAPVELLTWTNEPTVLFLQKITDGFHEAYPDQSLVISNVPSAEVNQVIQTRVSAANVDIVSFQTFSKPQVDWNVNYVDKPFWQQYIDDGLLVDLTDQEFMKNYSPELIAGNLYNGRSYSVSEGTVAYTGIFYNKAIFTELGLSEQPSTWAEFIEICEAIKAAGYPVMTAGAADNWPLNMFVDAIFNANYPDGGASDVGQRLLTGELKHTDPELAPIYDMVEQFASYLEPGVTGVNYSDSPGRFAAGTIAMYADGSWSAPIIATANPDLDFGYFCLPGLEPRADGLPPQYGIKYDLAFSVPTNAPNQAGGLAFLEYFSRKDIYTDFLNSVGGFSPTQSDITLENEFLNSLAPGLQKPSLNPEHLIYELKGVGEYGAKYGFSFFYLDVLGGPMTKGELATAAEQDYQTARDALEELNG